MKIGNVVLGNSRVKPDWCKLRDWLKKRCPDIVTLQKIGPSGPSVEERLREIGYEGCFIHHARYDRGVGVLANRDFLSLRDSPAPRVRDCELPGTEKSESRFLSVSIGAVSISSIYAPYCKRIGPTVDWIDHLRNHVNERVYARQDYLLCGDFSVRAIDDTSKGKLKRALAELKHLGFVDLYRTAHRNQNEMPGYTRGCGQGKPSRLHLILASETLACRLQSACMESEPSLWPRKDAPPLVVDLDGI